jgi:hypothetical protein
VSKFNSTLTAERVREVLDYDPETGLFAWKIKPAVRVNIGDRVGWKRGKGYLCANVDRQPYCLHRLAWLWFYGQWPSDEIDHINGVRDDNRIANLRIADRSINNQNLRRAQRNNRGSGLLGAYRHSGRWQAQITFNGAAYCLGTFDTPTEAHQCYLGAKRLFHPGNTL